jgi:hypothetical protein
VCSLTPARNHTNRLDKYLGESTRGDILFVRVKSLCSLMIRCEAMTLLTKPVPPQSCSSADISKGILAHTHFWRGNGVWTGALTLHWPFLRPCSHKPVPPQSCSSADISKRILAHTHFWRGKGVWTGALTLQRHFPCHSPAPRLTLARGSSRILTFGVARVCGRGHV